MPRKILLVTKSSPFKTSMASESFRIATAMIAMDVLPQLLFIDDGVYCLLKNQRPEVAGLDSYYERLETLAALVGLYATRDSMAKRNLKITDLDENLNVKLLSIEEAAELIMKNETVIAF
jgi:tRNA 2-thiouridine synthesizing protein C